MQSALFFSLLTEFYLHAIHLVYEVLIDVLGVERILGQGHSLGL